TAGTSAPWMSGSSTAKRCLGIGRWTRWGECDEDFSLRDRKQRQGFRQRRGENWNNRNHLFRDLDIPAKISQIHSLEQECKLRLRSKTAESSEAKVTAPKANVTGKSFLILPSLAIRKFLPILPTAAKL